MLRRCQAALTARLDPGVAGIARAFGDLGVSVAPYANHSPGGASGVGFPDLL